MKLALESTAEIVVLDGVPARVWHGTTETGAPCVVYVVRMTRVAFSSRYAHRTDTQPATTRAEIERTLERFGASKDRDGARRVPRLGHV